MRAKIVREVEIVFGDVQGVAEAETNVPVMELEDGREVPAYFCDRFIEAGTVGNAEYDISRNIWKFTPDSA